MFCQSKAILKSQVANTSVNSSLVSQVPNPDYKSKVLNQAQSQVVGQVKQESPESSQKVGRPKSKIKRDKFQVLQV